MCLILVEGGAKPLAPLVKDRTARPPGGAAIDAQEAVAVAPRVLICGGEERGTWLLEQKAASDRTFAFALSLTATRTGALALVALDVAPSDATVGEFTLPQFFDSLRDRRAIDRLCAPGLRLNVEWL